MEVNWLYLVVPVAIAIAVVWLLSRFQIRIMRSKHFHEFYGDRPSGIVRDEKSVSLPMPEHIVELMKQGRQDEAIKAMRELTGAKLDDGGGTVKNWTSDDGTVHVVSRTVTYGADDLPPEVIELIRDGKTGEAIARLRADKGLSQSDAKLTACRVKRLSDNLGDNSPTPKKKIVANENAIPTKDEINDPTPQPFSLDE